MTNRKTSNVWSYFTVQETDKSNAVCMVCKSVISRGRSDKPKNYTTSALLTHLRTKHGEKYREMRELAKDKANSTLSTAAKTCTSVEKHQQKTSSDTSTRSKVWEINSPDATRIHVAIAKMIAVDMEPFHIVEKPGFKELIETLEKRYKMPSRRYFVDKVIPKLYYQVEVSVASELHKAARISFTTNTWTAQDTDESFFCFTAHWLTESFDRRTFCLQCSKFDSTLDLPGSFETMLRRWGLARGRVHVVLLRDSKPDFSECFRGRNVKSLLCFAHSGQLCIREGLTRQKGVVDLMEKARNLMGHFKHSRSAVVRLHNLQRELEVPVCRLLEDVETRRSSTYLMLDRLLEQRDPLTAYCAENESVGGFTSNQWSAMANVVSVLKFFEEATQGVISASATISDVIPLVTALTETLGKAGANEHIETMKCTLLAAVESGFSGIHEEPLYSIATFLDPRYKLHLFNDQLKEMVITQTLLAAESMNGNQLVEEQSTCATDVTGGADVKEPDVKRQKMNSVGSKSLWNFLDDLLADDSDMHHNNEGHSVSDSTQLEINQYSMEKRLPRTDDPVAWWRCNAHRFPKLSAVARAYLGAPPTSVPSECLFSTAGDMISDNGSRLLPENAEKLIFLKFNLPLVNVD